LALQDNTSVLLYFKQFKSDFGYATYLDIVVSQLESG